MKVFLLFFLLFVFLSSPAFASEQGIWELNEPMPTPRAELAGVVIDEKIYVIGGFDFHGNALATVEVYDTRNDSWSTVSPMPEGRDHPAAAAYDGKIYVVGGFEQGWRKATNTLFIYDPKSDEWTIGKNMPTPRGALSAEFIGNKLYAVGGADHFAIPVNEVYDVNTETWDKKSPPPITYILSPTVAEAEP